MLQVVLRVLSLIHNRWTTVQFTNNPGDKPTAYNQLLKGITILPCNPYKCELFVLHPTKRLNNLQVKEQLLVFVGEITSLK